MTAQIYVLPDVVETTREYLAGIPLVTDLVPIERITIRSPRDVSTPWVRLSRTGGQAPQWQRFDRCDLQFESWVTPDHEDADKLASLIARTLRAALHACKNFVGSEGVLSVLDREPLGLRFQPDTSRNPPIPRFIGAVSVIARPKEVL